MSYDPNMPDMPGMPDQPGGTAAAEKVNVPGIFLIIVGALNILGCLYFVGNGIYTLATAKEQVTEATKEMTAEERKKLEEVGFSIEGFVNKFSGGMIAAGILGLPAAVITILGGIKMRALRSRGLAVLGSVLAMIPCLSPTGCCLLGIGVGIWALVVLSSADVKAAFR